MANETNYWLLRHDNEGFKPPSSLKSSPGSNGYVLASPYNVDDYVTYNFVDSYNTITTSKGKVIGIDNDNYKIKIISSDDDDGILIPITLVLNEKNLKSSDPQHKEIPEIARGITGEVIDFPDPRFKVGEEYIYDYDKLDADLANRHTEKYNVRIKNIIYDENWKFNPPKYEIEPIDENIDLPKTIVQEHELTTKPIKKIHTYDSIIKLLKEFYLQPTVLTHIVTIKEYCDENKKYVFQININGKNIFIIVPEEQFHLYLYYFDEGIIKSIDDERQMITYYSNKTTKTTNATVFLNSLSEYVIEGHKLKFGDSSPNDPPEGGRKKKKSKTRKRSKRKSKRSKRKSKRNKKTTFKKG